MKSRIAVFLTVVGLLGATGAALALAGGGASNQSASAGQYCPSDSNCGTGHAPPPPNHVTVSGHTLSFGHPIQLNFVLSGPGTITVTLVRTVHGKTVVIGTITITFTHTGHHNIKLSTRFAGHTLDKGNYTVRLQTGKGKHTSKAVKTKVKVG